MQTKIIVGDVRSRRVAAGLTQLDLAQRAGCAESTIRLFDRGYTPAHSAALARALAELDRLEAAEADREAAEADRDAGWQLQPGVGVSCYRGDTDRPEAA